MSQSKDGARPASSALAGSSPTPKSPELADLLLDSPSGLNVGAGRSADGTDVGIVHGGISAAQPFLPEASSMKEASSAIDKLPHKGLADFLQGLSQMIQLQQQHIQQ